MKGGDAIYSVVYPLLTLTSLRGNNSRPISLGSTAPDVRVVANDFGVV